MYVPGMYQRHGQPGLSCIFGCFCFATISTYYYSKTANYQFIKKWTKERRLIPHKKNKKIHFNIDSTQFANLIQHFNIGTEVAKIVFHTKIKYFHFKFSVYLQITNVVRSFFLVFFYTKSFPPLEYICSSFF